MPANAHKSYRSRVVRSDIPLIQWYWSVVDHHFVDDDLQLLRNFDEFPRNRQQLSLDVLRSHVPRSHSVTFHDHVMTFSFNFVTSLHLLDVVWSSIDLVMSRTQDSTPLESPSKLRILLLHPSHWPMSLTAHIPFQSTCRLQCDDHQSALRSSSASLSRSTVSILSVSFCGPTYPGHVAISCANPTSVVPSKSALRKVALRPSIAVDFLLYRCLSCWSESVMTLSFVRLASGTHHLMTELPTLPVPQSSVDNSWTQSEWHIVDVPVPQILEETVDTFWTSATADCRAGSSASVLWKKQSTLWVRLSSRFQCLGSLEGTVNTYEWDCRACASASDVGRDNRHIGTSATTDRRAVCRLPSASKLERGHQSGEVGLTRTRATTFRGTLCGCAFFTDYGIMDVSLLPVDASMEVPRLSCVVSRRQIFRVWCPNASIGSESVFLKDSDASASEVVRPLKWAKGTQLL